MRIKSKIGLLGMLLLSVAVRAAVMTQTIPLEAGWNAAYLYVQPLENACQAVFEGYPIESVWQWNYYSPTHQFISTPPQPDEMSLDSGQWRCYFPDNPLITNMHAVASRSCYLIKCTAPCVLEVTGTPGLPKIGWKSNSYNLVGFHVAENAAFFQDYFMNSSAHFNASTLAFLKPIYVLRYESGSGRHVWKQIVNTATEPIVPGKAYWIYSAVASDYTGPIMFKPEYGEYMDYGFSSQMQELTVRNLSEADSSVGLTLYKSGGQHVYAPSDSPPLWWQRDKSQACRIYDEPIAFTVPYQKSESITFMIDRRKISGERFDGLIRMTAGHGVEQWISTSSEKADKTGLWAGSVEIRAVEVLKNNAMAPVSAEFSFPIIIHFDSDQRATLLGEVIELWQRGEVETDPVTGYKRAKTSGRSILVTRADISEALLASGNYNFTGLRGEKMRGRRLSSALFPGVSQVMESDNDDLEEGVVERLKCNLDIDKLFNPFFHQYHPSHNKEAGYPITRKIELKFTKIDPDSINTENEEMFLLGWGDTVLGGWYHETIEGLHKTKINGKLEEGIQVQGIFRLYRVCRTGQLITKTDN